VDSGHSCNVDDAEPPTGGVIEELGLKAAETCEGRLFRVRSTGELKLPSEVTVTVEFPHAPWLTKTRAGLTDIRKSAGAGVTVNVTVMLCVIKGKVAVPVTVRLYVPMGVLSDVGIVNVEDTVPPGAGVTDEGTMLAWVPGGKPPVTCKLTAELKLPIESTDKL
jgi:hypothetical protein